MGKTPCLRGHLGVPDTVYGPLIVPLNYLLMQHTDVGDLAQMWFIYQNIENVVQKEVPKLMVDLALNPI